MNTLSDETPKDGKQRRKSKGTPSSQLGGSGGDGGSSKLSGGKTRRYSIGITTSRKSIEEEGNTIPNYLRASTGSCHDICKHGKKHEHWTSSIPIKFKRSAVANKEKVTKMVVPVESKKTTMVTEVNPLTGPKTRVPVESVKKTQALKRSFSTNGKATENELKVLHRSTSTVKPSPVTMKQIPVTVNPSAGSSRKIIKKDEKTVKKPTESLSPKASFSRASSLKAIKYRSIKQVAPLKDQNTLQKTEPKKTMGNKVQRKVSQGVQPESEATSEILLSMELIGAPVSDSSESSSDKNIVEQELMITNPVYKSSELKEVLEESLGVLPESEATSEILQSMELIGAPVSDSSESSSDTNVVEKKLMITDPVYKSSELKEVLKESLGVLPVVESSESSSDKEVSLVAPPVSESSQSSYDNEFEHTDDEELEFSEEESETTDDENEGKIPRKGRMVISEDEAVKLRFRRGKVLELESENNGPRRLKFRKGKVLEGNEAASQGVSRRSYKKKNIKETNDSNHGPESVVLKHQGDQGKKDAQGLFNNVIEETASKLVESRKSKVKALVGAFETVISLQDGKP